jgi:alkylation response protein AidB-like acyl-CoA dehydrogenase
VFFTDVWVPRTAVLGDVDHGWEVAMLLLSFERGASAMGQYTVFRRELDDIVELARRVHRNGRPAASDPVVRQEIARLSAELECLRLHSLHVLTEVERGHDLGAAASMTKLQWSETHQDIGELFTDVAGVAHQDRDRALDGFQQAFLWSRSETIWGGTSQVQRNIVAERLLGLPR